MVLRYAIASFFIIQVCRADDIYLKNGFVLRNVQVIDTTNGRINFNIDGKSTVIDVAAVLKVDLRNSISGQKASYEMFSRHLRDQYQQALLEKEELARERKEQLKTSHMANETDSLQRIEVHLDSTYSWRSSIYVAGGWGIPQGGRFELGYNFGQSVALGISFGIGDNWSGDPLGGTLAILGSIRFPIQSSPVIPYLLLCTGRTIYLEFFPPFAAGTNSYTLIYVGAMITVTAGIQLRPELGIVLTTKRTSGLPPPDTTTEERSRRFGANVTIELDLAHIF